MKIGMSVELAVLSSIINPLVVEYLGVEKLK
jgi:hypothetical protein